MPKIYKVMDSTNKKVLPEQFQELKITKMMNVENIFDAYSPKHDEKRLYLTRFGIIPNIIEINRVNGKKFHDWFIKTYSDKIVDSCFGRRCWGRNKENICEQISYFLFDDLMVSLRKYSASTDIQILYKQTEEILVDSLVNEVKKFINNSHKKFINLLVSTPEGLGTESLHISKVRLSIAENYNDDFLPIHQTILNRLRKKHDKGLVMLHGKPGTGKTSYIRYLITQVQKPVIFLPPNMAASITDPGLMNVLIDNPNSIFVIEDAENIIIDRNCTGSSSVSALLNLADGLLSDCLNIQIICSFNTDLSRVDSALTRKGRLIAKYEFAELEVPKAQALSSKLGISSVVSSPMTLAALYNQHEMEFAANTPRRGIGFLTER